MPNKVAESLKVLLADTFSLYLKTHKYHWNVVGSDFFELHTFFEKQYNEMWEAVDEIAEHIRALDEYSPGSYAEFSKLTKIKDAATEVKSATMLKDLLTDHETVIRSAEKAVEVAEKAGDTATADFATARIDAHKAHAWMLRSYSR